MPTVFDVEPLETYTLDPRGDIVLLLTAPQPVQEIPEPPSPPPTEIPVEIIEEPPAAGDAPAELIEEPSSSIYDDGMPPPPAPDVPADEPSEQPAPHYEDDIPPPPAPEIPAEEAAAQSPPCYETLPPAESEQDPAINTEAPQPTVNGDAASHASPDPAPGPEQPPIPEEEPPPPDGPHVRVRVSSHILQLAARKFDELVGRASRDHRTARLRDDALAVDLRHLGEPEAFLHVLNALHFRTRAVPRAVSLGRLAAIARLVDALGCREAVELFSDGWIEALAPDMPAAFCDDVARWICVAWVFERAEEFRRATEVAQRGAAELLGHDESSPFSSVPAEKIYAINETRSKAIAEILARLQDRVKEYQDPLVVHCSEECDAMVLGALTRKLNARGILSPPPTPFSGLSVRDLAAWVADLQLPSVHRLTEAAPVPVSPPPPPPPPAEPEPVPEMIHVLEPQYGRDSRGGFSWGLRTTEWNFGKDKPIEKRDEPELPPAPQAVDAIDEGWEWPSKKMKKKKGRKRRSCDPLGSVKERVAKIEESLTGLEI